MTTTKTTHTPGPWTYERSANGDYTIDSDGGKRIAEEISDPANARLIAAAPELLAFAERAGARFSPASAGAALVRLTALASDARALLTRIEQGG